MEERFVQNSISSGYRPIQNGSQYEKYFGQPDQKDRIILEDGEVNETVVLMKKVVWKYINDTKQIASSLKASTLEQTAENIWNFLYNHIQYKLDKKGVEQLRRPNRSWSERTTGIDCDCFSIFVSSILTNLQIPHSFRITRYDEDYFQHVYVILPTTANKYITIDCVLSAFNYEKPFTEKRDFTMNLNGINVAVLSGTNNTNVLDLVNDLEGLGSTNPEERLNTLYNHLVKTREVITKNPYCVIHVDFPPAFIKMLDYAIENWNTPNREQALSYLEMNENELNRINGLADVEEHSDLEGIDTDWSELEGLDNIGIMGELSGLDGKTKKKKAKAPTKKKFFNKIKDAIKKGGKAFVRFNPVSVAARNGLLLAMKLNLKKMSSKLKWAYATQAQATAKGVTADQWNRSKSALAKIEKLFADKLQGKRDKLKAAILKGKAGGINGVDSEYDMAGLGFVAAASLAAAIPVIGLALKVLVDSGLMTKKESENIEAEIQAKASAGEEEMKDQKLFEPSSSGGSSSGGASSGAYSSVQADTDAPTSNTETSENSNTTSSDSDGGSNGGNENKIFGFIKKNPLIVAGGLGVLGLGAYLVLSGKKPKSKPMNGVKTTPSNRNKSKKILLQKNKNQNNVQVVRLS
jgi:hypothetical protein